MTLAAAVIWSRSVTLLVTIAICCTVAYVADRVLEVWPCAIP